MVTMLFHEEDRIKTNHDADLYLTSLSKSSATITVLQDQ